MDPFWTPFWTLFSPHFWVFENTYYYCIHRLFGYPPLLDLRRPPTSRPVQIVALPTCGGLKEVPEHPLGGAIRGCSIVSIPADRKSTRLNSSHVSESRM